MRCCILNNCSLIPCPSYSSSTKVLGYPAMLILLSLFSNDCNEMCYQLA
ncbi:unnamed protein product, partial [Vitis vinifera]|uniref:Uncharacterized protein n=1 Tax=Vitis vinifera TaxID=29760 RepID=D7TYV0_VITVI